MSESSGGSGPARPPIWARPERGTRGPTPAHDRDEIVEAAITLADSEGLPAVTMRAVATALGTGAGSLYRYLSSRDDLLDLMADQVMGELSPYPEPDGDWPAGMLALARGQLELYRRHPWLLDVLDRVSGPGPNTLAWFDHCLRILEPVRCAPTAKFEAIAMMIGVTGLFARQARSRPFTFSGIDPAAYPHITATLTQAPPTTPPGDLFERTLRSLLTGLLA